MTRPTLVLAAALLAAALLPAPGVARPTRAALPLKGVLVPGKGLAGVRLGDSQQRVLELWGDEYRVCDGCELPTWFFTYGERDPRHDGLGAAVAFRNGRAVAVFTLGATIGWRTSDGLVIGDLLPKAAHVYEGLRWKSCIGYVAMTMQSSRDVVTSIYTDGNTIYG